MPRTIRIVCTSDTHCEDPTPSIPSGDVFIHAGDLTNSGTYEELSAALAWISRLPHEVKVIVSGNHDFSLDPFYHENSRENYIRVRGIFTSTKALDAGVHYLENEVRTLHLRQTEEKPAARIKVYGNPYTPQIYDLKHGFTYPVCSGIAWPTAPTKNDNIDVWAMHGPPKNRLDKIHIPGLEGCPVVAKAIREARPLLCVFGHFHLSRGAERVVYSDSEEKDKAVRMKEEDIDGKVLNVGARMKETIFVNAAWMTELATEVEKRNLPVVVDYDVDV